jgi:hypothetical protein
LNNLKIQNKWTDLLKETKSKELIRDIEVLKQIFERNADRANDKLSGLEIDIKEADDQLSTAIKSHLINIDTLIDLQNSRLASLQRQFEADLGDLNAEFSAER